MSTQGSSTCFHRPEDLFPGAEGWLQPSSAEISRCIRRLSDDPESEDGSMAARWMAEEAWHSWYGRHESVWMKTLIAVDGNLDRSIRWSIANEPRVAIAATGALARYWYLRNGFGRGMNHLLRSLDASVEVSRDRARAMSGVVDAGLSLGWKMPAENVVLATETIELYRRVGERWGEAHGTWHLGLAYCYVSKPDDAMNCFWQAQSIFREISDPIGEANVLLSIASLPFHLSPIDVCPETADLHSLIECLGMFRSIGNDWGQGVAMELILRHKRHLSPSQRMIVRESLLRRASERWAEWDRSAALEAAKLASEL